MIKFPKVHIATSVVNRILNVHEQLEAPRAPATPREPPAVPDPGETGETIDAELEAPAPPVTADDELAEQISLRGLV